MAAPTTAARVKKALANPEPSTHGPRLPAHQVCFQGEFRRRSGHSWRAWLGGEKAASAIADFVVLDMFASFCTVREDAMGAAIATHLR
jgi:hypothetical protein